MQNRPGFAALRLTMPAYPRACAASRQSRFWSIVGSSCDGCLEEPPALRLREGAFQTPGGVLVLDELTACIQSCLLDEGFKADVHAEIIG